MEENRLRLGELLVEAGVLQPDQLEGALALQKKRGIRLGQVLLQEKYISEPQLVQALSRRLSIPWVSLEYVDIEERLLNLVPSHVAEEFFLIPVYVQKLDRKNQTLFVAMNDPTDDAALRFVSATAGMPVKPMVAGPSDISAAIQAYYYGQDDAEFRTPMVQTSSVPAPLWAQSMDSEAPAQFQEAPPASIQDGRPTVVDDDLPTSQNTVSFIELKDSAIPLMEQDILVEDEELKSDAPKTEEEEEEVKKQQLQREVEKHMFGVGPSKTRGLSLTLLDGTTISFGGATKKQPKSKQIYTMEDLAKGLHARAGGNTPEKELPSEKWEDYAKAMLSILVRKNLIFFDEFIRELKKNH